MHTLTIEIPEKSGTKEILLSIASQLYTKEVLSLRQAADLAGVSLNKFIMSELPENDPLRQCVNADDELTAEEIVQKQIEKRGYTGANKERLDALRDSLAIEEPLELLLSQLTK
ncbi:UPF0175 family protein [Dyadobacter sp. CY326]|uniref:UPF0175 family protein n=1 Tax=Dyadobacter sp. CY326 TaxID=2907300 RepID=UPI001F16F240|nr:UPF0175 family protein [Dyadobacter sp. CY326]MCE7064279.1 UPF0175 family protein [Dyadobacter sp. CY326]